MLSLMTTPFDTTAIRSRVPKYSGMPAALFLALLLPGCSAPPPPVVSAPSPMPSLQALHQAEEEGYAEGFAAGKKVQARHDRAMAAEHETNAPAKAAPPAQVVQTTSPPAPPPAPTPPTPPAPPAPSPAIIPAAPPTPAQNSYDSSGPAQPLGSLPPAF
jgi:hypothetical protein